MRENSRYFLAETVVVIGNNYHVVWVLRRVVLRCSGFVDVVVIAQTLVALENLVVGVLPLARVAALLAVLVVVDGVVVLVVILGSACGESAASGVADYLSVVDGYYALVEFAHKLVLVSNDKHGGAH